MQASCTIYQPAEGFQTAYRFPNNDLALIRVDNDCFGMQATRLLHSPQPNPNKIVTINIFATGKQMMSTQGIRLQRRSNKTIPGRPEGPPYLYIHQGRFATSLPIIQQPPQVRGGVCGAPLLITGGQRPTILFEELLFFFLLGRRPGILVFVALLCGNM
ncbi:hypothetical protein FN846DRAFT_291945 [Sphaerosporella brunnea]|uniref:Uncharacterized protein n=1 Tax=Sphaerosporella brunnea TaxID=1250544 RepID=A0A5J5EM00_9PEZI|nr:hypothetical protein FN846DRAFT_291945 [Sphaerosporella brunnea]